MAQHQCHLSIKRSFFSTQLIFLASWSLSSIFPKCFWLSVLSSSRPPDKLLAECVQRQRWQRNMDVSYYDIKRLLLWWWFFHVTSIEIRETGDAFQCAASHIHNNTHTYIYSHFAHTKKWECLIESARQFLCHQYLSFCFCTLIKVWWGRVDKRDATSLDPFF